MLAKATTMLALVLALASTGCRVSPDPVAPPAPPRLGLMTTLPLYWAEAASVGELVQGTEAPGWVRQALETRFVLAPLDTLEDTALAGLDRLMLAQPRALTPAENVALDAWVRRGGRLVLLADPMLTRESRFGIGDKRRPQDVVLLSPILTHWGLALAFDPDQPETERTVDVAGNSLPVAVAGTLSVLPGGSCEIAGKGVLARCRIGKGSVTVLADAAILDDAEPGAAEQRRAALLTLLQTAIG